MPTEATEPSPRTREGDWEIAGIGSRMLAGIFDAGLLLGLWLLAAVLVLFFEAPARAAVSHMARNAMNRDFLLRGANGAGLALLAGAFFLVTVFFYVIAELVSQGRSPGKRALGLCVVRADGGIIGVRHVAIRNLARIIDGLPGSYGLALIAALVSPRTQRLGDLLAGTIVVRERPRGHEDAAHAAGSAAGKLVAQFSTEELALLAGFWARAPMLAPDARARLAAQIAPVLRARLADTSALDAEGFLWALLRDGAPAAPR
jgi:uncharacterized RDD family membrane protein YckC